MKGHFGIGIYHGKTEHNIGTLFRSAQAFGANFIFTVGRRYHRQASDTGNAMANLPYFEYRDIDDLIRHLPFGSPLIGVELTDGAIPVGQCAHMKKCVYLLGAEDHGLPPDIIKRCHHNLIIPGASRCLNVSTAGSIVMFDRFNYLRAA